MANTVRIAATVRVSPRASDAILHVMMTSPFLTMPINRLGAVLVAGSVAGWPSLAITRATIEELARRERVNRGYMSRMVRLTLLAPDIVEAILDGRQPAEMQLDDLLEGFPLEWDGQRRWLPDES
jgi:hypothetical protein